ncbi:MAG: hypothetical protein ACOX4I_08980 [Anaerovoracaceae bacterium]|jgi:hypothetical protein
MKKRLIAAVMAALMAALCLTACSDDIKYLTEGEWAKAQNTKFGCEVEQFTGDIYAAGDYKFKITGYDSKGGKYARASFDIYVSKTDTESQDDLKESENRGTIGGPDNKSKVITLKKGDYIYVWCNGTPKKPSGILTFKRL